MAIKSILSNKVRSLLTMLGVIIGVCSVIALIGIGQGTTNMITDQLKSAGANTLTVQVTGRGSKTMDPKDIVKFTEENPDLFFGVTPNVSGSVMSKNGVYNSNRTSLEGVNDKYFTIRNTNVTAGRLITANDVDNRLNVALVGTYIQNELFGGESPIGKQIKLNGDLFDIVGVLEEKGDGSESSQDNRVIIPYSVAVRLLNNATVRVFVVQAKDENTVDAANTKLKQFLYKYFSSTDAYTVQNQKELMDTLDQAIGTLTGMLAGIAAISLLVGGIGIMNIMLVSVSERTREIGIRKAIGAKRRDILAQFLIESAMVSAIGGVIGIVLGVTLSMSLGNLIGVTAAPDTLTILGSFSFSMFMGVFFGFNPANKASKLNPIEALRFE